MSLLTVISSEPFEQILAFVFAYLLGSIPFAWIVARLKGVNLLKVGSGSSGATNAARAIGWRWFFPIFALDMVKGFAPVFLTLHLMGNVEYQIDPVPFAMLGAVLGHIFSPWLKFKGGKAVATGVGAMLALSAPTGGVALGVFLLVFLAFRYVSLASICGAISVPFAFWFFNDHGDHELTRMILVTVLATFVIWKHRTNVARLLAGTESRAVKKKAVSDAEEASA